MSKKEPAPSDLADKFMLRMPDGMRDRIRAAAENNNRSMNAEIVASLLKLYPEPLTDNDSILSAAIKKFTRARTVQEQANVVWYFNKFAKETDLPFVFQLQDPSGKILANNDNVDSVINEKLLTSGNKLVMISISSSEQSL